MGILKDLLTNLYKKLSGEEKHTNRAKVHKKPHTVEAIKLYLLNPTDNQSVRKIIWTEHEKDALQAVSFTVEHAKAIKAGKKVTIPLAKNYKCRLLTEPYDYQLVKKMDNVVRIHFEGREFHLYHRLAKKMA